MAAQMISLPVFHVQSSGMKSDSTLSDIFPLHVSATVNKKLGSDFTGETKEISDYGCPNLPQMFQLGEENCVGNKLTIFDVFGNALVVRRNSMAAICNSNIATSLTAFVH